MYPRHVTFCNEQVLVQFDLKDFIEITLKQVDNGKLSSGVLTLGKSLVMFHARSVP